MLNIDDIKKRLDSNPEPIEVTKIREEILNKFSNLEFVQNGHKYFLHKENEVKEMKSVSSICHIFEPYVDWEDILDKKSVKLGVNKEDLRRTWKENNILSTSNGSLTHLFAESYMHFFMGNLDLINPIIKEMQFEDGFLIPYGNKQTAIAKYYEDLYKIKNFYPVMPETQVYIDSEDNPYGIKIDISGTFDALFAYKTSSGEYKLSIRDWKTNKSLINEYNQNNHKTLLYPFNSLSFIDEPKSVYTIQLSLYQLCLEQLGYKICDRKLLWLTDDMVYHKIDVEDVSDKLIKELSH